MWCYYPTYGYNYGQYYLYPYNYNYCQPLYASTRNYGCYNRSSSNYCSNCSCGDVIYYA